MNELDLMLIMARDELNLNLRSITYLGDAVYATFDGYQIWLLTTNGIEITNKVALEPYVWQKLMHYKADLLQQISKDIQNKGD